VLLSAVSPAELEPTSELRLRGGCTRIDRPCAASSASGLADVAPDDELAERDVGIVDGIHAQSPRSAQEAMSVDLP
jgi:hypothetical protein